MRVETEGLKVCGMRELMNSIDDSVHSLFCAEIERLAENKMRITGKLEGAHYAAMCVLRKRLEKFE